MKKIDILMATYNGEKYLREQIDSILSQTYKNFNLIISDDSSTDGTQEILKEYEQKDKRIKIFFQKNNLGLVSNFEFLLKRVESEFFMFSDQDDVWEEDKIEISYDKLESDEADLVYSDLKIVDEHLNIIEKSYWSKKGFRKKILKYNNFESLYLNNYITGSTILCKSKWIEEILLLPKDSEFIIHDYWVSLIVSMHSRITYVDKAMTKYRQHKNNKIGSKKRSDQISSFDELRNLFIRVKIEHFKIFVENKNKFTKKYQNLNDKSLKYFIMIQNKKIINLKNWLLFFKLYKYENFTYKIENFLILNVPIVAKVLFKIKKVLIKIRREKMKNENKDTVIKITNLVKEYKMYARKKDRLTDALFPWKHKYSTFTAMNNLNLEVKKGEVLGILGKNGAGKSTLLKMITGVVIPTSGTIETKGKISSLLELGAAFNSDLTGYENIYQHGTVMGLSNEEIKEKENEIIEFADIGDHLYQPVKTYSSGMFARLAFACAINVNPDILIVDEVLSVGDMAFQLKCFKKFDQFKKSGKTILFVTHSVGAVLQNCTRAIIIDKGSKIFEGGVKEGVEKYKKLIVGLDDENDIKKEVKEEKNNDKTEKTDPEIISNNKIEKILEHKPLIDNDIWKDNFIQNQNISSYGDGRAEVIDYGIFDENGSPISAFDNKDTVILKSKIRFNEDVENPIFTMTFKDFHGNDITGTNTEFEHINTGKFKKGDIAICEFKQKIPIGAGKYTLSFSCTKYSNGKLEVLNRKYDALLIEVISSKSFVGIIKLDSDINIHLLNDEEGK